MIIYAGIVFGLLIAGLIVNVAKETDGLTSLFTFLMFVPVFGRIFGLW